MQLQPISLKFDAMQEKWESLG